MLTIKFLGKQLKRKVKFSMWNKNPKGMAVAKELSSTLNGMKDMPNKYKDTDDIKITTDK